ncbi:protein kinase [Gramella jeungdoensis]|uniref:Protein kinase n=1 Tax=Gramella jeungdoensis TaxID=708091 RepID=A0ABT0Z0G3_9FLAO|nr:serine/threonine protein kinase [Gramella jeungdoensis]MCM8568888.1 protein kinase [Gramella jeungdoensis]
MAKIIKPPYFEKVVNAGEQRLMDFLEVNLPENYTLIPNIELAATNPRNHQTQYWEYDLIVVTPHAVYNIENKDWKGRIEGDDNYWYVNDRQRPNPLKTGRIKTAILASKLKEEDGELGKAWIQNMVTLSYPNSIKPSIWKEAGKVSFQLDKRLINYITDPESAGKWENAIADIQDQIIDFLVGKFSEKKNEDKKELYGHEILEIVDQENYFTEYLAKPKGVTSSIRKRIKEYTLQVNGFSPEELKQRELKIKNGFKALEHIKSNPFITNVQYELDEENHLFYEITDFLEEDSLRNIAKSREFTFSEKIDILKNIMAALKAAHEQNVFHRDINPDNIYYRGGYAMLGNFGKAYFTYHNEEGYTVQATINEQNATPYHALELTVGEASRASDLYSFGVLAYWLFVGEEPINSPYELNNLKGRLPEAKWPSKVKPSLPTWIDELCNKTILIDEFQRIDNVEELEEFIRKVTKQEDTETRDQTSDSDSEDVSEKDLEEISEGDRIGDYTIYNELGKGGYSKVFRVKHSIQGTEYAMKLFNKSVNDSSVKDEYKALVKLNHPNIVKFIWNGTTPSGQFYTLTELLDGENLGTYVRTDARLPIHRIYKLATDVLSALVVMQSQNPPMYHRDIKPQNIIWDDQERFVLIDFNVASFAEDNTDFVGTNPYLAPDLITDSNNVNWDRSADVFSLGITLYELVCKKYPWAPHKMPVRPKKPNDPKKLNDAISSDFAAFLLKAISTEKEERFSSAQEMLDALEEIGLDNLLAEKQEASTELPNTERLYHTEITIYQPGCNIKLADNMQRFVTLNDTIDEALGKFKDNLKKYKNSIKLNEKIKVNIKVDSESIVSEIFWNGDAKSFTEGNIDRVYNSLVETVERNKEKIKRFKVDVEGLNIVEYINSLYSQSKQGNFGTRASQTMNEFDKLTYSPSLLDQKLIPDILDDRYKLLIITGNAGDGKTAFIKEIEQNHGVKNLENFKHNNGARFEIKGTPYESNYDGSQDQEENANNEVLDKFFEPFENIKDFNRAKEGRIIAINEGRLVDFLMTSSKHKDLYNLIDQYFYNEGHYKLPEGVMIINLNLRSVVADSEHGGSLFRKQVKKLTNKALWSKCEGCSLANQCFIKYNVDSFNDPASGDEVISRMEWLLRTVSLKRELHITMRDLRSFIAFTLTRDYECPDIDKLFNEAAGAPEKYWQYYYFNITSPNIDDSANQDRLIKLLRETDIGEVPIPDIDRNLFFDKHRFKEFIEFSEREINLIEQFNKVKSDELHLPVHEKTPEILERIRKIQKTYIRHHYYEAKSSLIKNNDSKEKGMPSFMLRLPYQSVFKFVQLLHDESSSQETIKSISRAIALNEGCDNVNIDQKSLVLAATEVNDRYSSSYRLFSLSDFELKVNNTEHLVKYLEYEPDSFMFRHKGQHHIKLTISLDLYEMLYFIQQGFSPSLNDIRGKFVELIIFKNLLKNLNYNEVVVTNGDSDYYKIKKDYQNKILIEPINF